MAKKSDGTNGSRIQLPSDLEALQSRFQEREPLLPAISSDHYQFNKGLRPMLLETVRLHDQLEMAKAYKVKSGSECNRATQVHLTNAVRVLKSHDRLVETVMHVDADHLEMLVCQLASICENLKRKSSSFIFRITRT